MTIERVLEALAMIGDYSDDDIARYTPLAQKNLALLDNDITLSEADEQRLAYLAGAKTNYEIVLINASGDGVTSFSAGDVKIEQGDSVMLAKEIYSSALDDASDLVSDSSFCFRSV